MFIIQYTLNSGETRQSQLIGDEETADRLRRQLLCDPQVIEATALPADKAVAGAS